MYSNSFIEEKANSSCFSPPEITVQMVMRLHHESGVHPASCKKALIDAEGDIDKASYYLKDKPHNIKSLRNFKKCLTF